MSNSAIKEKFNSQSELYSQYNWFSYGFLPIIEQGYKDFFNSEFSFKLASLSKNINVLFQGDDYFVTKIKIDKQHDAFFRCSSNAVKIVLENILGKTPNKFDLTEITELEAKIISSFNDFLFGEIGKLMSAKPAEHKKRKNFDMIHLTFFIKDKMSQNAGKIILSLPQPLLNPEIIIPNSNNFDEMDFKSSKIEVNVKVGTTKFPVKDLKSLDKEDIVLFENSNTQKMSVEFNGWEQEFRITPNPGLITSLDNNDGGNNMEANPLSKDLWDNIQVEMGAEFEKVKISLGELKNIEQGLVVDISSVYDNKITLKVENKAIAKGELVIIDDRYGVRIDEVFASEKTETPEMVEETAIIQEQAQPVMVEEQNIDDDFDYSDFELEDEDI